MASPTGESNVPQQEVTVKNLTGVNWLGLQVQGGSEEPIPIEFHETDVIPPGSSISVTLPLAECAVKFHITVALVDSCDGDTCEAELREAVFAFNFCQSPVREVELGTIR